MFFNSTLTFDEQAVVIAVSFFSSLASSAFLGAFLFGMLPHMKLPAGGDEEWACGVVAKYVAYRWCPRCCCANWRRHLKARIIEMQEELEREEKEDELKV